MAARELLNQEASEPELDYIALTDENTTFQTKQELEQTLVIQALDDLDRALAQQQLKAEKALAAQQGTILPKQNRVQTEIQDTERIINYSFADTDILFEALQASTSGVAQIGERRITDSNMRLAMIGDSILQTLVVEDRYAKGWTRGMFPCNLLLLRQLAYYSCLKYSTHCILGQISNELARLTSNRHLAIVGKEMGIDQCIYRGEKVPKKDMVLTRRIADTMEAIIGAVYLDGGLEMVRPVLSTMGLS
jgi:ribonuclease-3